MTAGVLESAERFVHSVGELPTLSTVMEEVMAAAQDPGMSFQRLAKIIERDPVLSARVLKVANSSYYQSANRIASIQQAITRIGEGEIRNIALATGVMGAFQRIAENLNWGDFWEHCLACGLAAHVLSGPRDPNRSVEGPGSNPHYTAGLLHHLGYLTELMQDPLQFQRARFNSLALGIPLRLAERQAFGFSHAESGAALLRRWRFPQAMIDAAAYHHEPGLYQGEHGHGVAVVHLGSHLCRSVPPVADALEGQLPEAYDPATLVTLGWKEEQLPYLQQELRRVQSQAKTLAQAFL